MRRKERQQENKKSRNYSLVVSAHTSAAEAISSIAIITSTSKIANGIIAHCIHVTDIHGSTLIHICKRKNIFQRQFLQFLSILLPSS